MKKLIAFAYHKKELVKKNRVLCTISGGQDSIVTFFLLIHIKKRLNFEIIYCQHFWQTKNFLSVKLILKLSVLFEIPYHIALPQNSLITENGSRSWRKKIFVRVARLGNLRNLLIGQTLTDNVESFFNNLLRGTTPKSLVGSNLLNYKKTVICFFSNTNLKLNLINSKILSKSLTTKQRKNRFSTNKKKNKTFLKSALFLLSKKTLGSNLKMSLVFKDQIKPSKLKRNFIFLKKKNHMNQRLFDFFFTKIFKKIPQNKKYLNCLFCQKVFSYSFCFYSKSLNMEIICAKPLSDKKRFSISKLIKFYDFPLLTDATNFSTKLNRNNLRYKLLPLIRSLFNQNFENLIKNFLETIELEQKSLQNEIEEIIFLLKTKKLTSTFHLNTNLQKLVNKITNRNNFIISFIMKKIVFSLQRSIIEKIFFNHSEIELTYLQIIFLQNLL